VNADTQEALDNVIAILAASEGHNSDAVRNAVAIFVELALRDAMPEETL
jgi:hypothetical protein